MPSFLICSTFQVTMAQGELEGTVCAAVRQHPSPGTLHPGCLRSILAAETLATLLLVLSLPSSASSITSLVSVLITCPSLSCLREDLTFHNQAGTWGPSGCSSATCARRSDLLPLSALLCASPVACLSSPSAAHITCAGSQATPDHHTQESRGDRQITPSSQPEH